MKGNEGGSMGVDFFRFSLNPRAYQIDVNIMDVDIIERNVTQQKDFIWRV